MQSCKAPCKPDSTQLRLDASAKAEGMNHAKATTAARNGINGFIINLPAGRNPDFNLPRRAKLQGSLSGAGFGMRLRRPAISAGLRHKIELSFYFCCTRQDDDEGRARATARTQRSIACPLARCG